MGSIAILGIHQVLVTEWLVEGKCYIRSPGIQRTKREREKGTEQAKATSSKDEKDIETVNHGIHLV